MSNLERAGVFKARVALWGVRLAKDPKQSKSAAVACIYEILAVYEGKTLVDISGDHLVCEGAHYFLKKDGTLNKRTIDQLVEVFGWDGNMNRFTQDPPITPLLIEVKPDAYNNKVRYRADRIAPATADPEQVFAGGPAGDADPKQVLRLDAEFGAALRDLAKQKKQDDDNAEFGAALRDLAKQKKQDDDNAGIPF
jgi:hypothetical protein